MFEIYLPQGHILGQIPQVLGQNSETSGLKHCEDPIALQKALSLS